MGYMFVIGNCISCNNQITFNPNKVPSIRVNGVREPICENCFNRWNQIHRIDKGLEPIPLNPDAYQPEEI